MRSKGTRILFIVLILVLDCTKSRGATLPSTVVRKRQIVREARSLFKWARSYFDVPNHREQRLSNKKLVYRVQGTGKGARSYLRARQRYWQLFSGLTGLSSFAKMNIMVRVVKRLRKRYRQFTGEQLEQSYEDLGSDAVPTSNNELRNEDEWIDAMMNEKSPVERHMELLYNLLTLTMSETANNLTTHRS